MGLRQFPKTRLAIIGAGNIARAHIQAFQNLDNVEIVGICAPTERHSRSIANEFQIELVCHDIQTLWERTHANAVIVAVPVLATNDVCVNVFTHNWMSLVEKPVGYNLVQAEELSTLGSAKNHKCFVALNRRHYGSTHHLQKLFESNDSIRVIRVNDQEDQLHAINEGYPIAVVENWQFANSIHLIDYFLQFGRGKISRVTRKIEFRESRLSHVSAEIEFSSGDKGLYEAVWNSPARWSVQVEVDSVIGELKPLEQARIIRSGQSTEDCPSDPQDKKFKPGFRRQAELFTERIRDHAVNNGLPTLGAALETMRLIDLIYGSPELIERTTNIE